jgi:oligopeptide/dipeptide ABC transporter ATP-binding protein
MIELRDLRKHFRGSGSWAWTGRRPPVRAVDGVSFALAAGESVGLVGESGSGKSTVGQLMLGLIAPTSGQILLDGEVLPQGPRAIQALRGQTQVVFQDPYDALNPRQRVFDIVTEPLRNLGRAAQGDLRGRAVGLLERVGLHAHDLDKYPHQFSGGQRQRIGIARAISVQPRFLVLDEPVSALDVSIQAQVVNLLMDIRREQGLAYLFISHNLAIVEHACDRIVVLYLGKVMEIVPKRRLHDASLHPYTRALVDAIPVPDPDRSRDALPLSGEIPDPANPPSGCRFSTRCPWARGDCHAVEPPLVEREPGHWMACHRHAELPSPTAPRTP